MSSKRDDARAAILRRRAAFLGSALAAAGCTPSGKPTPSPDATPVVSVAEPAPQSAEPAPSLEPPPPKSEAGRPPYEVPSDITEVARKNYEHLHKTMKEMHGTLTAIESDMRDCDPKQPDCERLFRTQADRWHQLQRTLRFFHICPGKSDEAKAFGEHKKAHDAHLRKRMNAAEKALEKVAGKTTWERLKQEQAKPYPCLSFACPDW